MNDDDDDGEVVVFVLYIESWTALMVMLIKFRRLWLVAGRRVHQGSMTLKCYWQWTTIPLANPERFAI